MNGKTILGLVSFLVFFLLSPPLSWGHKVNVFAWVEGDRVFTEGFFSDGKKAGGSRIDVFNGSGQHLLTGQTDREGMFSFKIPQETDLKIVLHASMGHRAEVKLGASRLRSHKALGATEAMERRADRLMDSCLGKQDIQPIIEQILDNKLRPILIRLGELEKKSPSLTEVLGAVGYIFGLVGVAVYFGHLKKPKGKP